MENVRPYGSRVQNTNEKSLPERHEYWIGVLRGLKGVTWAEVCRMMTFGAAGISASNVRLAGVAVEGDDYVVTMSGTSTERMIHSALPKEFTDIFKGHVVEMRAWCPRCRKKVSARHGAVPAHGDHGIRCSGRLTTSIPQHAL